VFLAQKEPAMAEAHLDQALTSIYKSTSKEHLKKNLELHADVYRYTN